MNTSVIEEAAIAPGPQEDSIPAEYREETDHAEQPDTTSPAEPPFDELATLQDVECAYRIFLQRAPDSGGMEHFTQLVEQGLKVGDLANKFTDSSEYLERINPFKVVDLGGYLVCFTMSGNEFGEGIIFLNDYEPHVRRVVAELFHEGQTFVDVGANIGCISLLAAKIAGPSGQVVAVEPNPWNLKWLYAGIVLNQYTNVRVLPYAASDRRDTFSLRGGKSNTFITKMDAYDIKDEYAQSVVLDEELVNLPRIDFVKMDIEGHEPFAMAGFRDLLRKHKPILLTEFNPRCLRDVNALDPEDFLRQILELYNNLLVISSHDDSVEFNDAGRIMDYWRKRDEELTAEGKLAAGLLHFDIIARNV